MGWMSDLGDHEGYAVGFVTVVKDGRSCSGVFRELGYADEEVQRIEKVAAACECGWRSARWRPLPWREDGKLHLPDFSPHVVFISQEDEDKAHDLWKEHVEHARAKEQA